MKKKPFSQQLREAIERSPKSRYAIAQETGIDQSTLSRFVNGTRWLTLPNIDRLLEVLDLEVKRKPKP